MQGKEPEYITMSQGIGKQWYEKFKADTYKDYVNVNFKKAKIPRYYDKQLEKEQPEKLEEIKEKRKAKAIELENKTDKPSNESRNTVKQNKLNTLKRTI
jgi:hypothetical protein